MLTGDIRNQVDRIWDAFWSGGIANPVDVIEQITYLLFLKRLDEIQVLEEKKANRLSKPIERRIFPEGNDPRGVPYEEFRWTRLKNASPHEMYVRMADHIFPFLRTLGAESTYAQYMTEARFTIPESLIARAVDLIDSVPMDDRDTKGDVYEYMLGKLATSGTNGQFRTPRHIIRLMVEMTAPKPDDVMVDPAAGTCGFLVVTGEYQQRHATDDDGVLAQRQQHRCSGRRVSGWEAAQPVPKRCSFLIAPFCASALETVEEELNF